MDYFKKALQSRKLKFLLHYYKVKLHIQLFIEKLLKKTK